MLFGSIHPRSFWLEISINKVLCYKAVLIFVIFDPCLMNNVLRTTETRMYKIWKSNLTRFRPTFPFLYFLKTSENLCFFDVFRGYRKGTLVWNGWRLNIAKFFRTPILNLKTQKHDASGCLNLQNGLHRLPIMPVKFPLILGKLI